MRHWNVGFALALPAVIVLAAWAQPQDQTRLDDPLQLLSERRVSVEFKAIRTRDFFKLFSALAKQGIEVDECAAERTLDLKFQNVPLRLVAEAIGAQANLSYRRKTDTLVVFCDP